MSILAQTFNPNPVPNYPPAGGGASIVLSPSGEATNPSSWGDFAVKVGIPSFLLIVMTIIAGVLLWQLLKQRSMPNNADQLDFLKRWMYASQKSHGRMHVAVRQLGEICRISAKQMPPEAARLVEERVDKINDALTATNGDTEWGSENARPKT